MPAAPLLLACATDAEWPPGGAFSDSLLAGAELLVTGVGKVAAALTVAERLARGPVCAVVSFGVAGAYPAAGLDLGDVIVGTHCRIADEGLETGTAFLPFARPGMPVPGAEWLPSDVGLCQRLSDAGEDGFRVVQGRLLTVSVCAGSARLAAERAADGALGESMEGAAVALAAARAGVPFVEVRGISNHCGPREGAPFDLSTAVRNASRVVRLLAAEAAS